MRQVTRADTTKVSKSGLGAQIYVLKKTCALLSYHYSHTPHIARIRMYRAHKMIDNNSIKLNHNL